MDKNLFKGLTASLILLSVISARPENPNTKLRETKDRHISKIEKRYAPMRYSFNNQKNHTDDVIPLTRTFNERAYKDSRGKLVYPDHFLELRNRFVPKPIKNENCIEGLCEDVSDYPSNHIVEVMSKAVLVDNYFGTESPPFEISDRLAGDEDREQTLCPTTPHLYYPKKAKNTEDVEKFIINIENYKQGLVFETCLENSSCRYTDSFPLGIKSKCKQKYVIRRLMALNETGQPAWDTFEVPSCCVCTIISSRSGL